MSTTNTNMASGKLTVPADSFNQRDDMNIEPSIINLTAGGIPQHWLNTAPISKRDMKSGDTPLEAISTTSSKIMTFAEYLNSSNQ